MSTLKPLAARPDAAPPPLACGCAPGQRGDAPAFAGASEAPYWLCSRAAPMARRVLPSLFDRLRARPAQRAPSLREQREQLRACVLRDLQALLDAANHEHLLQLPRDHGAAASCWNYGACVPAGAFVAADTRQRIERGIREAIVRFEPRIDAGSLSVRALQDSSDRPRHNLLRFAIDGFIRDLPQALAFSVQSTIDLETRHVQLHEQAVGASVRKP